MKWMYRAKFDKRRMRRELISLAAQSEMASHLWDKLTHKGAEDIDRLALADIAEEEGYPILAKMIREWTEMQQPRQKYPRHRKLRRKPA